LAGLRVPHAQIADGSFGGIGELDAGTIDAASKVSLERGVGLLRRRNLIKLLSRLAPSIWILFGLRVAAQPLLPNPTPEIYVNQNGHGAEVVPNGQLSFDGKPFTCGKFPTVLDPLLNDYAAAPYKGFIILNPKLVPKVSAPVKLWIFHHECGHALGIKDEAKADCFSAQRGKRAGWLTLDGLEQVCEFIGAGRADSTHRAGTERCAAMRRCYGRSSFKHEESAGRN
jgi:hypothetical protein